MEKIRVFYLRLMVSGMGVSVDLIWGVIMGMSVDLIGEASGVLRRIDNMMMTDNHHVALSGGISDTTYPVIYD